MPGNLPKDKNGLALTLGTVHLYRQAHGQLVHKEQGRAQGGHIMAKLSLRQAAEQFDVSRPTLSKALKSGKVSGEQDESGTWRVDTSELTRVYSRRDADPDNLTGKRTGNLSTENKGLPVNLDEVSELKKKLAEAEKRAAVAEALAEERAQRIDDLRRLLPAPGQPVKKPSWWPF